jgi:hypothetical protein
MSTPTPIPPEDDAARPVPAPVAVDPAALPADRLAELLTAWAAGDSAAVGLLAGWRDGYWLRRPDFVRGCIDAVDYPWTPAQPVTDDEPGADGQPAAGTTVVAGVLWEAVAAWPGEDCPQLAEVAVLRVAASLAGQDTGSLRALLAPLADADVRHVLDAVAHAAGWRATGRTYAPRVREPLPGPTPDHLAPAMTRLREEWADARRRDQVLLDLNEADPDLWRVTPELAAARPDLAPRTITLTDYRQVLTCPHTAREAGDLLTRLIKCTGHLGYTIALGVDLTTDPTGLDWLTPLPQNLALTVAGHVPAAAGWTPHGDRANAHHAAQALTTTYPPPRPARRATPTPAASSGPAAGRAGVPGRRTRRGGAR